MSARRRQKGMVLVVVLFFVLLLAATVTALQRRVILDTSVVRHRDAAREAEALARGGIRLAEAVLLEDLRIKLEHPGPESLHDIWSRVGTLDVLQEDRRSLRIAIQDLGGRFNLNTIDAAGDNDGASAGDNQRPAARAWIDLFAAIIDEMPGRPEEKLYDPELLYRNLVDWIDADGESTNGESELDPYARRPDSAKPPDRPLLSIDELRLVEGFDGRLVEALKPYVTIYPLRGKRGINLNTAEPWVLAKLEIRDATGADLRPIGEDDVRRAVEQREKNLLCGSVADENCVAFQDAMNFSLEEQLEPPFVERSHLFEIQARARVGNVERTVVATIDRSEPPELKRLDWRLL